MSATVPDSNDSALSVAASASVALAEVSLSFSAQAHDAYTTIHNTVAAFVQGGSATAKSTIGAGGDVTITAGESSSLDTRVGSGAIAIGLIGGSLGVSTAENTVTSTVTAYIDNASLTVTGGGGISIGAVIGRSGD